MTTSTSLGKAWSLAFLQGTATNELQRANHLLEEGSNRNNGRREKKTEVWERGCVQLCYLITRPSVQAKWQNDINNSKRSFT